MAIFILAQGLFIAGTANAKSMTGKDILDCVNGIRTVEGKPALATNGNLDMAATLKLEDMKKYRYWSHANPVTGAKPWDFVEDAGYDYAETGENLAIGYKDSAEVCAAWENSSTHLANIANEKHLEAGIAVDNVNLDGENTGILVVMMFGSRAGTDGGRVLAEGAIKSPNELRNGEEKDDAGGKLRNVIAFVIIFSYITTFIVLIYNYLAKRKMRRVGIGKPILLILAVLSVIMTLVLFVLIM